MSHRYTWIQPWTRCLLALLLLALLVGCAGSPAAPQAPPAAAIPTPTEIPLLPTSVPEEAAEPVVPVTGASDTVDLAGTGTGATVPFTMTTRVNRLVLSHDGGGRFVVLARYPNGSSEFLLNATGRYRGSRVMLSSRAHFEIEADGPWTVRIESVGVDESAGERFAGTGDVISNWFTPPKQGEVTYTYTHGGERNFYVQIHCDAGVRDHIYFIDAVGTTNGSAVADFDQGPCLWDIQADGAWQIQVAP